MDKDPKGIVMTGNQFQKLLGRLQNRPPDPYFWTISSRDLGLKICPLAQASRAAVSQAIHCLLLPSQEARLEQCSEQCPLLSVLPFPVNVTRNGKAKGEYLVDPATGLTQREKLIEIPPAKPVIRKEPVYHSRKIELEQTLIPDPEISRAVITILHSEYKAYLSAQGIAVPRMISRDFLEQNTSFRMLNDVAGHPLLPVDDISLDLAGWAYTLKQPTPKILAKDTGYELEQVMARSPITNPLIADISSAVFPPNRFMDIYAMYRSLT